MIAANIMCGPCARYFFGFFADAKGEAAAVSFGLTCFGFLASLLLRRSFAITSLLLNLNDRQSHNSFTGRSVRV
jgi:hypothetical protein